MSVVARVDIAISRLLLHHVNQTQTGSVSNPGCLQGLGASYMHTHTHTHTQHSRKHMRLHKHTQPHCDKQTPLHVTNRRRFRGNPPRKFRDFMPVIAWSAGANASKCSKYSPQSVCARACMRASDSMRHRDQIDPEAAATDGEYGQRDERTHVPGEGISKRR